jgi:hypothetical protein
MAPTLKQICKLSPNQSQPRAMDNTMVARWFVFKPKIPFGSILEGLARGNHGIFYNHLVYFTAIGNISRPFGIFCGHLTYFSPFWYIVPRKIWQPWTIRN